MEEHEVNNIYSIPANYTDSGLLLGMFETRNAVEAGLILLLIGYPELMWMPLSGGAKAIVMIVTLMLVGVFALTGIDGDSLLRFLSHVIRFAIRRRILHFRRLGNDENTAHAAKKKRR